MQAKETKLQDIIEGTKQYVIPLFQRTYSWTDKEWGILWKDLAELCDTENPRTHFIGSIVNMPTVSVPEGVAKYLLIDGQQRLTTIFIILTLLRNKAREGQNEEFAGEINNTLLVNPYKKDNDFYKLMPTQVDRDIYKNLINGKSNEKQSQLTRAYDYFEKKLRQDQLDPAKLKKIITTSFSVVSILLDADDNPYLVFESLNSKGRILTAADLIRNYFFMRIHVDKQEQVYSEFWQPMQNALETDLTEFIRHFLMKEGAIIKQTEIYYVLKDKVSSQNAIEYLTDLQKHSVYYQRILHPDYEIDKDLQKYFRRLNEIEVTTAYPLLLKLYNYYASDILSKEGFLTSLQTIENYLIRRFVCGIPTNQLNKIFPVFISQLATKYELNIPDSLKDFLQTKGYPKDNEFKSRLKEAKLYGGGDRYVKTKLILRSLEEHFAHKENVLLEKSTITIEHIMPQTLSETWEHHLGEDWGETHERYLHTIGNLTLTAYNSELSNDDFFTKRELLIESHLELNKYFLPISKWTKEEIDERSESLAN